MGEEEEEKGCASSCQYEETLAHNRPSMEAKRESKREEERREEKGEICRNEDQARCAGTYTASVLPGEPTAGRRCAARDWTRARMEDMMAVAEVVGIAGGGGRGDGRMLGWIDGCKLPLGRAGSATSARVFSRCLQRTAGWCGGGGILRDCHVIPFT